MRLWLLLLAFFLPIPTGLADDFPDDFSPTFVFHETYRDVAVADPSVEPGDPDYPLYVSNPRIKLTFSGEASIVGLDLAEIDILTNVSISLGALDLSYAVGDDPLFDPEDSSLAHSQAAIIDVEAYDADGNIVDDAAKLRVSWTTTRVKVSFSYDLANVTDGPRVASDDYVGTVDSDIRRDDLDLTFSFARFSMDFRSVYIVGKAAFLADAKLPGEDLSDIVLDGSLDSIPPSVAFTSPAPAQATIDTAQAPDGLYTFAGTVSDTRKVDTTTYPGAVQSVSVRVGATSTGGSFVPAVLDGQGNWTLSNYTLLPGANYLTLQAVDVDGNVRTTTPRLITYTLKTTINVTASATGYNPAASGAIAGTVSGDFLKNVGHKLTMLVGATTPPKYTDANQLSGTSITLVAKPGVGSVFNGWVGTVDGNTVFTETSETLRFDAVPKLFLNADFVPNPFTTLVTGRYQGLVSGASPLGRGTIVFNLTKTGIFSGSMKIGALVLPLKGKVTGNGAFKGKIVRSGKTYDVVLNLNTGAAGDRKITGTVIGNGLNSTVSADLNPWKKGNEVGGIVDVGFYNVLLPADPNNTNPGFPNGIGFGRVSVSKYGSVRFTGKLGDGSAVTSTSILAKRDGVDPAFPIYVALDKKLGSIAGTVSFTSTATSDLAGSLDWQEPATTGVEPQAFAGKVALHGSFYEPPLAPNPRVILNTSLTPGDGKLAFFAPAFNKPIIGPAANIAGLAVNLSATNVVGPVTPLTGISNLKLTFNAKTGLFSGSYRDEILRKNIVVAGAASTKANSAGGVFIRGNRAGGVTLVP